MCYYINNGSFKQALLVLLKICIKILLTCASEDLSWDVQLYWAFPQGLRLRPRGLTIVIVVTSHQRGAAAEDLQLAEALQGSALLLRLLVLCSPPGSDETLLVQQILESRSIMSRILGIVSVAVRNEGWVIFITLSYRRNANHLYLSPRPRPHSWDPLHNLLKFLSLRSQSPHAF